MNNTIKSHVYRTNLGMHWLRGLLAGGKQTAVHTKEATEGGKGVAIDNATQYYKVSDSFMDDPLELTNYLLVRSKETVVLHNKVNHPDRVLSRGKSMYGDVNSKSYDITKKDLFWNLQYLPRVFTV